MAPNTDRRRPQLTAFRLAGWGVAAALVLLPFVAMQFTDEVRWSVFDFIVAGVLVGGVGVLYELAVRSTPNWAYRAAVALALAAAFLLVWLNLAVGIIGSENNPANLMYGGVLVVGTGGALLARFQPMGMSRALVASAVCLGMVAGVALAVDSVAGAVLTAGFAAMCLGSAWLFRRGAGEQASAAS